MISLIKFMEVTFTDKQNPILKCLHWYSRNKENEYVGVPTLLEMHFTTMELFAIIIYAATINGFFSSPDGSFPGRFLDIIIC